MYNDSNGKARRAFGRATNREFSHDCAAHLPECLVAIRSRGRTPKYFGRHSNERHCGGQRVSERRLAARDVPPVHSFGSQSHRNDAFLTVIERHGARRNLNDVRTAVFVEKVCSPEVVQERLAIVAVTEGSIDSARRNIA